MSFAMTIVERRRTVQSSESRGFGAGSACTSMGKGTGSCELRLAWPWNAGEE